MKKTSIIITIVRMPYIISEHLFGKGHSPRHRISVGVMIMIIGVSISKMTFGYTIFHFLYDGIGYLVHGIGCLPIIEYMEQKLTEKDPEVKDKVEVLEREQEHGY
jgi:hypothetical protein